MHQLFLRSLVLLTPSLLCTSSAAAVERQDAHGLIGQTVTVISDDAQLTRNGTVIGEADLGANFKIDGVDGDLLFTKARNANLKRDDVVLYRDAIDFFTRRIEAGNSSDDYDRRGRCWQKRGANKQAIDDFTSAIRIDPYNYAAYVNRGIAWEDQYDLDKALADFNESLRIRPYYIAALADRGGVWARKGNFEKAIADWSEVIRMLPREPLPHNNSGWAYIHTGDLDAAMKDLDEAIHLNPNYAIAYKNRGDVWLKRHDYDKAIAESSEAIRRDSSDPRSFLTRANARLRKGLIDDALTDFEKATRLDPAMGHNAIGWFRATSTDPELRDADKAIEEATRACELTNWKYDSNLQTLSAALAEQGKFEEATKRLQQAIEANPGHEKPLRIKMMEAFQAGKPYHDDDYRLLP